jgi:hypothetical protein
MGPASLPGSKGDAAVRQKMGPVWAHTLARRVLAFSSDTIFLAGFLALRRRRNSRSGASCYAPWQAHPDYGDVGIYREGHRASSKAKPRRDATSVPRSSERLICRCRGQIGPESDGAAPTSNTIAKRQAATLAQFARDGPAMPSAQRLTNEHL